MVVWGLAQLLDTIHGLLGTGLDIINFFKPKIRLAKLFIKSHSFLLYQAMYMLLFFPVTKCMNLKKRYGKILTLSMATFQILHKMTTPESISKCFRIYSKLGVVISYGNMYKH